MSSPPALLIGYAYGALYLFIHLVKR